MAEGEMQEEPGRPLPGRRGRRLRNLIEAFGGYADFLSRLQAEYGPIASFELPSMTICVLFDAELMQEVLVAKRAWFEKGPALKRAGFLGSSTVLTGDAEPHRRRRRLLRPAFDGSALAGYGEVMAEAAASLANGWRDGRVVDMAAEMQRAALAIETGCFFGRDAAHAGEVMLDALEGMRWRMKLVFLPWGGLLRRLPLPRNLRAQRAFRELDAAIREVIRKARSQTAGRADLISLLARAEDEAGTYAALSDLELRDELYAILVAAHEPLANAMAWAFHHLTCYPPALERLQGELDHVLAGRPPAPADLESLPYLGAVFDEALRLTPPVTYFGRRAIADCTIGGYRIRAGTTVQMMVLPTQHDTCHFPEPERFLPERWLERDPPQGGSVAELPFGGGDRRCVGSSFARMAAMLVLGAVIQRWRLEPLTPGPVAAASLVVYRPKGGLPMRLSARAGPPPVGEVPSATAMVQEG